MEFPASYKHFNNPTFAASSASMARSGAGAAIGNYSLTIDYTTGDITCGGGAAGTCAKLGF